jgi:hypothetical protein
MKLQKILFIMATATILASCEEGENPGVTPEPVEPNTPTTFSFKLEAETDVFFGSISGYYEEETGECFLIAEHGNLIPYVETDTVEMTEYHSPIYLFYENVGGCRLAAGFTTVRGQHTTFILSHAALGEAGVKGLDADMKNIYEWPHSR